MSWLYLVAAGFGAGLSLIAAIGPQGAFVLRQGLLRAHAGTAVAICAASDLLLITAGVLGGHALFAAAPWLATVARLGGAAFLLVNAALALRRALRPRALGSAPVRAASRGSVALVALGLTWLNPHAYLDAFVLLGSLASTYGDDRWAFGLGAIVASVAWFMLLGFGARLVAPAFRRPVTWQLLDGAVAVVMAALGLGLLVG